MSKPGNLLKTIADMQKRMSGVQAELEAAVFEGSAGGGVVKVSMTGKGEIKSVVIDNEAMSEDNETVADLVVAASRDAYSKKEALAKEKLASVTSGLLPLGLKIPGLG